MSEKLPIIYCFGTDRFEIVRGIESAYVKVWNDKLRMWQTCPLCDCITKCPVCGKDMHVYYIPGTTWLALCSDRCSQRFDEKVKELGGPWKALRYFLDRLRKEK